MANFQAFVQAVNSIRASQTAWHADLVADLAANRAAIVAITAKLDLDGGVADNDYNTLNPVPNKTV